MQLAQCQAGFGREGLCLITRESSPASRYLHLSFCSRRCGGQCISPSLPLPLSCILCLLLLFTTTIHLLHETVVAIVRSNGQLGNTRWELNFRASACLELCKGWWQGFFFCFHISKHMVVNLENISAVIHCVSQSDTK